MKDYSLNFKDLLNINKIYFIFVAMICYVLYANDEALLSYSHLRLVLSDEDWINGPVHKTEEGLKPLNIAKFPQKACEYGRSLNFAPDHPVLISWVPNCLKDYCHDRPSILRCKNVTCNYYRGPAIVPRKHKTAYVIYGSSLNDAWPLPRYPGVIWGLTHEESPKNVPILLHNKGLKLFNYSSTFSRHSDVPFPLFEMKSLKHITNKDFFVTTSKKNTYLTELAPIIYLQSICDGFTDRDNFVLELMKTQRVDSYGKCLNNKKIPEDLSGENYLSTIKSPKLLRFIARYKFMITIENGVCEDYVTEKFWRAIHAGVVPIYFGSPSIKDWLPNNKSAILLQDFDTPKQLSDHIDKLMNDDMKYEEHLQHKTKGVITNEFLVNEIRTRPFQTSIMRSRRRFDCFICEKLHTTSANSTRMINKLHYNCPTQVSVLTRKPFCLTEQVKRNGKFEIDQFYRSLHEDPETSGLN